MLIVLLLDHVGVKTRFTPRSMEVDVLIGLLLEAEPSEGLGISDVRIGVPHKVEDNLRPVLLIVGVRKVF